MADDNKDNGNLNESFEDLAFQKVEDKYTVNIIYDSQSEVLSLKFLNQTTKNVFKHGFDKENMTKITDKCPLGPDVMAKMIIDTLKSKELTGKNVRLFLLPNIKQATAKYDELRAMKNVPDAMEMISGFQPKLNANNVENSESENCLIFVLHFSHPPYIFFNYTFIIKENEISENDKLSMKIHDLQKENKTLKEKMEQFIITTQTQQQSSQREIQSLKDQLAETNNKNNTQSQEIRNQSQLIQQLTTTTQTQQRTLQTQQNEMNQLTQRLQQLQTKVDDNETKTQEINLNLQNNWKRHNDSWSAPKALKLGRMVSLQGLISGGTYGHIATLPEGWRPSKYKIFSQCSYGCSTRVDVDSDGRICQESSWKNWLSLEGITFMVD